MAAAVALALLVAASDPRPTLIAAGAKRPVLIEQEAVRRVQRATRGVMEAARAYRPLATLLRAGSWSIARLAAGLAEGARGGEMWQSVAPRASRHLHA